MADAATNLAHLELKHSKDLQDHAEIEDREEQRQPHDPEQTPAEAMVEKDSSFLPANLNLKSVQMKLTKKMIPSRRKCVKYANLQTLHLKDVRSSQYGPG